MSLSAPSHYCGRPVPPDRVVYEAGFFGQAAYVRAQTASEIEDRLGYRRGRLAAGWWLLFMLELPSPQDFEMMGYSYFSGGIVQGHLPNPPDRRTAEQRLQDEGYDVQRIKSRLIERTFTLDGHQRLAKVVPVAPAFGEADYPVGTGVPQWALRVKYRFKLAAFVPPGGRYTGDYI